MINTCPLSLSEQNLIDCNRRSNGCGGGLATTAFQYIKENRGIDTENSYPYEAKNNRCRYNPRNKGASDYGFKVLPRGNEYYLKTAIATQVPYAHCLTIASPHYLLLFRALAVYQLIPTISRSTSTEEECTGKQNAAVSTTTTQFSSLATELTKPLGRLTGW